MREARLVAVGRHAVVTEEVSLALQHFVDKGIDVRVHAGKVVFDKSRQNLYNKRQAGETGEQPPAAP